MFAPWTQAPAAGRLEPLVAIDGKTLRRSVDWANGKAAIHRVRAWASGGRMGP